jgi:3-carboxy-cis,cis-muconate cycloisomerase
LAIPLIARLRAALEDAPAAAAAVHNGATSQDLADTIMVLQAKAAMASLGPDLARLSGTLADLAERYSSVPAVGRTLLQDAVPITFGLRAAQWLAGVTSAWRRLQAAAEEAMLLQLGGAAGTRAGMAGRGAQVADTLARLLGLTAPTTPWHARRDTVAALAAAVGIVIGTLGKIGRDISLLAQDAIGEAREPSVGGRGGSSAMSHKRNPAASRVSLSAAIRAPGLVAAVLAGLPQEQERGLGGWQNEAPLLADLFMLAAGSAAALADAVAGLEVDKGALQRNLTAAEIGSDTGEAEAFVRAILDDHREKA